MDFEQGLNSFKLEERYGYKSHLSNPRVHLILQVERARGSLADRMLQQYVATRLRHRPGGAGVEFVQVEAAVPVGTVRRVLVTQQGHAMEARDAAVCPTS